MSAGIVRGWSGRLGGLSGLEIFDKGPCLTSWGEKQPCFKCWEGEDFCRSCSRPENFVDDSACEKLGGQLVEVLRGVLFSCWQSRCIFPGFEVLEDLLRWGRPSICVWKLLLHVKQNSYFLLQFLRPHGQWTSHQKFPNMKFNKHTHMAVFCECNNSSVNCWK